MTILAVCYACALFTLLVSADFGGLRPIHDYVNAYGELDKVIHFVMYGGLALAVNLALVRRSRGVALRTIATGTIIVLFAATAEEFSNKLVPCRGWSLGDLAANYLGILLLGVVPVASKPGGRWAKLLHVAPGDTAGPAVSGD